MEAGQVKHASPFKVEPGAGEMKIGARVGCSTEVVTLTSLTFVHIDLQYMGRHMSFFL